MNNKKLGLFLFVGIAACFINPAKAELSPESTTVTVSNESSYDIPDVRIKAVLTDKKGRVAKGSAHILNLGIGEEKSVDLKGITRKVKALTEIDLGNLTSVLVTKVQPKGGETPFASRRKFKPGTTVDSFAIFDNPTEEYKVDEETGTETQRLLKVFTKRITQ